MEKQLLNTFLDLYTFDSKIESWSLEKFSENPPRLYRLQIITSIMNALSIPCDFSAFRYGDFTNEISIEKWEEFKTNQLKFPISTSDNIELIKYCDINSVFYSLMNYRLNAQALLASNDGIYAASDELSEFLKLTIKPNKMLIKELKKIDKILLFCINPTNIKVGKAQLRSKFNYPNVDLNQVDLDWL